MFIGQDVLPAFGRIVQEPIWIPGGGDPYYANVVLLLHCNGSDGSTTFTDNSAAPHTFTAVGNAQIDTAQFKFGGASGLFDGASDYLLGDGSSDFAYGSGDFTIEMWVRPNALTGATMLYDGRPNVTNGLYPTIYLDGAALKYFTNSADRITGGNLTTGQWYFVTLCRSGTSTKLFIDGVQTGSTYTDSNTYLTGTGRPFFGALSHTPGFNGFNGWLDDIRITKGIARYAGDFTPPTAQFPDS